MTELVVEIGDQVTAHWATGTPRCGKVVKYLNALDDGSRVFAVRIDGHDYAFNERDLLVVQPDDPYLVVADKILTRLREPLARALEAEGL